MELAIFEIPPQVIEEHLAAFLLQCGHILGAFWDSQSDKLSFEIMLNRNAFLTIPNCRSAPEIAGHRDKLQSNVLEV